MKYKKTKMAVATCISVDSASLLLTFGPQRLVHVQPLAPPPHKDHNYVEIEAAMKLAS